MQGHSNHFSSYPFAALTAPSADTKLTPSQQSRKVLSLSTTDISPNPLLMGAMSRSTPKSMSSQQQAITPSKGSLFVGDISYFCTEADLVRLFEPYGRVLHVEVRRNAAGESLRHGFAELESVDAAQRAIHDLHSSKYMGRRIRVHWACVHVDKRQPRDRTTWTQIYVSFCATRRERIVTESLLDEIFSRFGAVADVTVKKHSLVASSMSVTSSPMSLFSSSTSSPATSSHNSSPHYSMSTLSSSSQQPPPVWTGYAFVYFYDRHDAELAAQALRNFESDDLRLACSLSLCASLSTDSYPALRPQVSQSMQSTSRSQDEMYFGQFARPAKLTLVPQSSLVNPGHAHSSMPMNLSSASTPTPPVLLHSPAAVMSSTNSPTYPFALNAHNANSLNVGTNMTTASGAMLSEHRISYSTNNSDMMSTMMMSKSSMHNANHSNPAAWSATSPHFSSAPSAMSASTPFGMMGQHQQPLPCNSIDAMSGLNNLNNNHPFSFSNQGCK